MISTEHIPQNSRTSDEDFTIEHFKKLLQLAKKNYQVVSYTDIPWGKRFLLWRHDLDYSLNSGLILAKTEYELGLKATYFFEGTV